jgi:hypothetical protein
MMNMPKAKGQGATEYLVLLAVVLVIALVAIALLMGNLGESMDKRVAESNIALMSGYPIAFVEPPTARSTPWYYTGVFFYMVNRGSHPITITKVLANGYYREYTYYLKEDTWRTLRELYHDISPGETFAIGIKEVSGSWLDDLPAKGSIGFVIYGSGWEDVFPGNASEQNCLRGDKYLVVKNFGFEYEENVNGNIITKQQIWKELAVPCSATLS